MPTTTAAETAAAEPCIRQFQEHNRCAMKLRDGNPIRGVRDVEAVKLAARAVSLGVAPGRVAGEVRANMDAYRPEMDKARSEYVQSFGWNHDALSRFVGRLQARRDREEQKRRENGSPEADHADIDAAAEVMAATEDLDIAQLRDQLSDIGAQIPSGNSRMALRAALVAATTEAKT